MAAFNATICDHSKDQSPSSSNLEAPRSKQATQFASNSPIVGHHSIRRREREQLLTSLWSHVWTKRQSPEWKPRRASVATCQRRYNNSNNCHLSSYTSYSIALSRRHNLVYQQQQQQQHSQDSKDKETLTTICRTETDSNIRKYLNQRLNRLSVEGTNKEIKCDDIEIEVGFESNAFALCPSPSNTLENDQQTQSGEDKERKKEEEEEEDNRAQELTSQSSRLTTTTTTADSFSGGSSVSSGSNTVISSATDHHDAIPQASAVVSKPLTSLRRRADTNRSSLDNSYSIAESMAAQTLAEAQVSERATAVASQKMDTRNRSSSTSSSRRQKAQLVQQNRSCIQAQSPFNAATCCSCSIAAAAACSLSVCKLGIEGLEAGLTDSMDSQPNQQAAATTTTLAMNQKLQLQEKQRKSLIYSMALKQMISASSSGSSSSRMNLIGVEREPSQCSGGSNIGNGGEQVAVIAKSCSATCCPLQYTKNSKLTRGTTRQQQQQPTESLKSVSDNSPTQPIDHEADPKLVSSATTTTATLKQPPLTCCLVDLTTTGDRDRVAVRTELKQAPVPGVGRRSASSGQMQVKQPSSSFFSSSSSPSSSKEPGLSKRIFDGGVERNRHLNRNSVADLLSVVQQDEVNTTSRVVNTSRVLDTTKGEGEEEGEGKGVGKMQVVNRKEEDMFCGERCRSGVGGCHDCPKLISSAQSTGSCDDFERNLFDELDADSGDDNDNEPGGENILSPVKSRRSREDSLSNEEQHISCSKSPTGNERYTAALRHPQYTPTTTTASSAMGCYCEPHLQSQRAENCQEDVDLESLIIESWLDDHPSFVQDYFMRKASRQLIDQWLVTHTTKVSNLLSSQPDLSTATSIINPNSSSNSAQQQQQSSNIKGLSGNGGFVKSTRSSSGQSGHATPVRKISATDFESRTGSGFLRPMVSTTPDGRPTFLSQPQPQPQPQSVSCQDEEEEAGEFRTQAASSRSSSKGTISHPLSVSETNEELTESTFKSKSTSIDILAGDDGAKIERADETIAAISNREEEEECNDDIIPNCREVKLIFELVKNICNDLDIKTLLHKILKNIAVLINADKSSLFLVRGQVGDPNRHLVSQLFNVDQDDSEVMNETNNGESAKTTPMDCTITIPWGTGLVGYVAQSGQSVNIANCYDDPRFTDTIDQRTGYVTRHMLCAPILDKRNEIVGVAQVINKRDGNPFSKSDELKFKRYLQFCGIGLRNAQSYEECQLENRRNQVLLDLARMVFEEQSTIEQVVYRIMLHTQSLLECQRCQVLLIDDGSDDLEQLLQLSSSSGSLYQQPTINSKDPSIAGGGGGPNVAASGDIAGSGEETPPKPEWRPQCNNANSVAAAAAVATSASDNIHHDRSGDNNNNSNNNNSTSLADSQSGNAHLPLQGNFKRHKSISSPKLFSLVFDLECDGNDLVMHSNKEAHKSASGNGSGICTGGVAEKLERRFPINIGITGYVAMTGETLNIEDAHQNERFDPSVDLGTNFRHKSILCMPIRNGQRQIIGVSQLINKKNGRPFNKNDEDLFEAFAIFCGLGIHNTLMYEKVLKIMAKQRVTFEVLSYHATAPLEEAKKLNSEIIPSCFALNLTSLKFNDFSLDEQFMLKSCLRFFLDLDLIRRFQIDQLVFCNWILSVQKNYRKVTYHPVVGGTGLKASPVRYHNWRHAFNVSQMMFAILINTQICQALGELETLALLIACLCHDLDHRGTNNSFQIKSASPLAKLYSTSTMEHHHFDQCVMILNSQGNQILANLSPDEYSRVIVLLEEAILATDLANYFQRREVFFQLVNGNQFEWNNNPEHRSLLRCMLMTACDVAAITKPWPVQKVVADLVMSEFYQQGDIEKQELNIEPIDMMNREKRSKLPEMQIGFIDSICAPIYAAFARLFPHELSPLLDGCLSNRDIWTELSKSNQLEEADGLPLDSCLNNNTTTNTSQVHVTKLPKSNINQQTDDDNNIYEFKGPFHDGHQPPYPLDHSNSSVTSCSLLSDHFKQSQHISIDQHDTIQYSQRKSV